MNRKASEITVLKNIYSAFICMAGLTILLVTCLSCDDTTIEQDNCNQTHLSPSDLKVMDSKKVLILIADDRSGSTNSPTQPKRISEEQYKALLQIFIDRGFTGQFALRIIGNAGYTGFESTLTLDPIYETKPIPKNAILSEKGRLRCINQRILDTCERIKYNNQQKVDSYFKNIIQPKVIKYKPFGEDQTDINSAFRDIEMKVNSNVNLGFDKVIVIVMSDGDDSNHSPNLTINANLPFDLILIGWPKNKIVKDENDKKFDSADELLNWIKNIKI